MDFLAPSSGSVLYKENAVNPETKYPHLNAQQIEFLRKLPKSVLSRKGDVFYLATSMLGCDYPDLFKKHIFGNQGAKTLSLAIFHRGEFKKARFRIVLRLNDEAPREMFHVCNNTTFKNLKLIEKIENRKLFMTEQRPRLDDIFGKPDGWQPSDFNTDNMIYISYNKFAPDHVKEARPKIKRGEKYLFEVTLATSLHGDRMFVNIKDMLTKPLSLDQYNKIASL